MIALNDFTRQWQDTREAALAVFERVGESGRYVLGAEVREFESALARYWGLEHAVGVGSGMDAIEIALRVLGCKPGDRVITSPISAFATTLAIIRIGAVPVFVDCDAFGLIDLDRVQAALASDSSIRFFVPVHLYGHALDLEKLADLGQRFDCAIVEDCAQSIGATHRGRPTGTAGTIAATSFYPTKNLGALGDGGAILCDAEGHASGARMWRDYGQRAKYSHAVPGYNSRLDELQAALLHHVYLGRLPCWTEARRTVAASYTSGITNPAITVPGNPPQSHSSGHLFPVLVKPSRKPDFMRWLHAQNVACAEHYPVPNPEQPAMAGIEFRVFENLEIASCFCRSEVSLPIHPYLQAGEIAHVVQVCNGWNG